MLVVYLSNRFIRVAEGEAPGGHVQIRHVYYTIDTRGCILNGIVTDEDGLTEIIQELWETNHLPKKDVYLVVDSSQFTVKVTEAPLQKPKKMLQFIGREFTDVERIENPVYGYFPMPGADRGRKKVQSIFAAMAPRQFVQEYLDVFTKLGITLNGIECADGAMIRMLGSIEGLENAACIIQFIDDNMLTNVLVVDGSYQYSSRKRLYADAGTVEFVEEIVWGVSSLRQFAKTQDIDEDITEVYVAGLEESDFQLYEEHTRQLNMGLKAVRFGDIAGQIDQKAQVTGIELAAGGFLKTNPRCNIMWQMRHDPEQEAQRRRKHRTMYPLIAVACVLGVLTGIAGGKYLYLSYELKNVKEYNNREDVLADCDAYDSLIIELRTVNGLYSNLSGLKKNVLQYPKVDGATQQIVTECAAGLVSAEISGYDSDSGIISFNTKAENVERIHQFIELLSDRPVFASVDYTGYTQDSKGQWTVKVNCLMADRQEESDESENNTEG